MILDYDTDRLKVLLQRIQEELIRREKEMCFRYDPLGRVDDETCTCQDCKEEEK